MPPYVTPIYWRCMRRTLVALLALMALSGLPSGAANITVRGGDTLSDIAERYGVSIGSLMRVNGLRDSNHVEAGQTLRLPEGAAAGFTAGKGRHTVRSGDTLGAIALQYRVSERQLMVLNGLASADHVEKGQTLKLPSNAVLPKPKTRRAAVSWRQFPMTIAMATAALWFRTTRRLFRA